MEKQTEIQIIPASKQVASETLVKLGDSREMIKRVHGFIDENFMEGVDYGPSDDRNPKNVLLKPGAEKVCRLFNLRIGFRKDDETASMIDIPNTVCYLCELFTTDGERIGEGRGAETVGNAKRDVNKAIKIAEKRALVDAVLYTFALSEKYTQDRIKEQLTLDSEKEKFRDEVAKMRTNVKSTLSTNQWIISAAETVLKEKNIQTLGALDRLKETIKAGKIDLDSGQWKR
jgi:hypothetical protein